MGLYFFLRYEEKKQLWTQVVGTLFFVLAVAFKPTDGGIIWLAYTATVLYTCWFTPKIQGEQRNPIPLLLSSLVIGASVLGWTQYVNWYNDQNGNHQNLIGIYPIWDMAPRKIAYTAYRILVEWSDVFQQKLVLALLLFMLVVYVLKWRYLPRFLRLFTLFLSLGTIAYAILWFKAFTDHDYYQLPFVLPAVFLCITVVAYFCEKVTVRKNVAFLVGAAGGILVWISFYHTRYIQRERYIGKEYTYVNPALFEMEPYLRSIGVSPHDVVVCVPDKSPNVSLNAINNYGYTEEFNSDQFNIINFQQSGAAYLLISDAAYLNNPLYQPFTGEKIGEFQGVYVFDIRKKNKETLGSK